MKERTLLSLALLGIAGCRTAPKPESRQGSALPRAQSSLEPLQKSSTPAIADCGLGAYPESIPTQEILAAVPRSIAPPNSSMLAKVEIDSEGKVTHLRVMRLAWADAPNAMALNKQAVDSIKRGRYAPTKVAGEPVSVCSDVDVTIDLR